MVQRKAYVDETSCFCSHRTSACACIRTFTLTLADRASERGPQVKWLRTVCFTASRSNSILNILTFVADIVKYTHRPSHAHAEPASSATHLLWPMIHPRFRQRLNLCIRDARACAHPSNIPDRRQGQKGPFAIFQRMTVITGTNLDQQSELEIPPEKRSPGVALGELCTNF